MKTNKINQHIKTALHELRQGRMLILTDDENREQEGDLVLAAEKITPHALNFMLKYARGIICLTLTDEAITRLDIPLMSKRNGTANQAAFTVSIDAAQGITSGASTYDRAHTIRVAVDPTSTRNDIVLPGHVFPLRAQPGGTLVREGHTEGSVDLVTLAGLYPAAVICEILNEDGTMARFPNLEQFANLHQIQMISINDIVEYRCMQEEREYTLEIST